MRKILLTGIGGDVACAVTRSIMAGQKDTELYGLDIKKHTPYMEKFKRTDIAPEYTKETEWIDYINDYIMRYDITHFLPITEPEILIADKYRDIFKESNTKLLINNSHILEICTSKFKTALFLAENGIDTPLTFEAEKYRNELEFPFIVKADYGCGSASVQIIRDDNQWKCMEKKNMVCQELIGNHDKEFTVGIFSNGKDVENITYKRHLGYGGMSVNVKCVDIAEINAMSEKVARLLKLEGSINMQIREQNGRYYVFEINPRLSSTVGFRHKMGFIDVVWWLDLVDGKQDELKFEAPVGCIGIKVTDDVVYKTGMDDSIGEKESGQDIPPHATYDSGDRGGIGEPE